MFESFYLNSSIFVAKTWWVKPLLSLIVGLGVGGGLSSFPNENIDVDCNTFVDKCLSKEYSIDREVYDTCKSLANENSKLIEVHNKLVDFSQVHNSLHEVNTRIEALRESQKGIASQLFALSFHWEESQFLRYTDILENDLKKVKRSLEILEGLKKSWETTEEEYNNLQISIQDSNLHLEDLKKDRQSLLGEKAEFIQEATNKKICNSMLGCLAGASLGLLTYACYTLFCN